MDDLRLINARLQELNKEFRDLSALKKEIQDRDRVETMKQKYSDFKYLIKSSSVVEEINFEKLAKEADLQMGKNSFGLPVIAYNFGNGVSYFSMVKSKEEASVRLIVDNLLNIAESVKKQFEEDTSKTTEANDVLNKFKEALEFKPREAEQTYSDSENLSE